MGIWISDSFSISYALGDTLDVFKHHLIKMGCQQIAVFLFALEADTFYNH